MPGERLVCVWQAAYIGKPETKDKKLTKSALRNVVEQLADLSTIRYSRSKFENAFKTDDDVSVSNFKRYLFEVLSERGARQCAVQEEVETGCWEQTKAYCKTKVLSESNVKKLWEISNRLADVDTYPPIISSGAADWFIDKVCSHLGKNWMYSPSQRRSYTFTALLDMLKDDLFSDETEANTTRCIDELYTWLVAEVMKSGFLYKRTRKQANWTNWIKRWFVLTSTHLLYYDNSNTNSSKKRGELFITGSKVETLPPYKGVIHKLQGRFKISNLPYIEMELSTEQYGLRHSWVTAIEETIDAANNRTTPIQRLLKERWSEGQENDNASNSKLEKAEKNATEATKIVPVEPVQLRKTSAQLNQIRKGSLDSASTGSDDESFDNAEDANWIKQSNDKMKAVFMSIDTDGNGKIDRKEFKQFIAGLGLQVTEKEINLLYHTVEKENNSYITFQEFSAYFANVLLDENTGGETETKLRAAFLEADRNGTGSLNFKDFTEYLWDKKRSIRISKLIEAFDEMDFKKEGQVSFHQFRDFYKSRMSRIPEVETLDDSGESGLSAVEKKLKDCYNKAEAEDLAKFVRERWNKFATFRRYGASGELAMKGGHGMVDDVVPGEYSLLDLALFSDLPPLVPKHTVVIGVKWIASTSPGKSGKVVFPSDFDGKLVTDTATPEHLRYYGCSFAEGNQLKISLLYRHGIQDFTYENKYLEDYVTLANGGSGIERHEFSHLDCPLEEDSGTFILAKFIGDDELHLTGFHVPVRHTLYIPGGVIHSNDYLKGTWRTMLSDEADIDHVHLVRASPSSPSLKDVENFKFEFVG